MAFKLVKDIQVYIGTAAERAAMDTTNVKAGSIFEESDTGSIYKFDGSSWFQAAKLWRNNTEGTLLTSAARTTSGNSADVTIYNGAKLAVFLDVTAVSGTSPTLDVSVKVKDPASGKYFEVAAFTQKTAVGSEAVFIGGGADVEFPTRTFRVEYTIGGTDPSFTFSIGYAVTVA